MKRPTVHILATVRQDSLLPAALLVFRTIRVGFPTANVLVYPNVLTCNPEAEKAIQQAALDADCQPTYLTNNGDPCFWTYPDWLRHVIEKSSGTNIICDTDVVFFEKVEDWPLAGDMMGWRIPKFECPYTKATTMARLHTCLLWMNCDWLKGLLEKEGDIYMAPDDLIGPSVLWDRGLKYFSDCMGQMANHPSVADLAFTERQLDAFGHAFSGTLVDLVGKAIPGLAEAHAEIYRNPECLRGRWREQMRWYNERAVNL